MSETFIKNSVGTALLTIALALAGIMAFRTLPVAPLPQVEFPTLQVQAALPGASPETMASSVATPLERQFGRIAGLTEMTSSSTLGQTNISLQFDLSRNIDAAARDVQAAINAARSQLPANLPSQPTYRKVNPADAPIMILSLTSQLLTQGQMYDAASSILLQKLSQVEGVGQVIAGGGALPAVRVELNPTQLNQMGISLEQVRQVLAAANANRPKGEVAGPLNAWSISTTDQLLKARQYRPLIVGYHNGTTVKLSDVGEVIDSVENLRTAGMADAVPAVLVIIWRQPGANIIDTVDRIRAALPALTASIPSQINTQIAMDRTTTIRASVSDVEFTLMISIALVVMVVFIFLRNIRATIIPGIVVPLSLIGTFAVMYLFGYSLDNLSLMALTICTGFVVDDAIVVIENISRSLEMGYPPYRAAVEGTKTIGFTVMSISISLIAVFIPILLMAGIVGRLFREFAVTLAAAVFVSMVISLTTTPMMCAKLLRSEHGREHGPIYQWSERMFDAMLTRYELMLSWVLEHSRLMGMVFLATLAFNIYLFKIIPKGFFSEQDTGRLAGVLIADQKTSFQSMREKLTQLVKIVGADPAVDNVIAFAGTNGGATNQATMFIDLKPQRVRKINAAGVIGRLRGKISSVPGASLYLQAIQDLRIGGRIANAEYQYTLQSDDLEELNTWAPRVVRKLMSLRQLTDVSSDQQDKGLAANLEIDRRTASRMGITPNLIDNTLYDAFGQRQVSTMYTQLNQYHVVMEVAPRYWQNPDGLNDIYISTGQADPNPLANANPAVAMPNTYSGTGLVSAQALPPGVSAGPSTATGSVSASSNAAPASTTRSNPLAASVPAGLQAGPNSLISNQATGAPATSGNAFTQIPLSAIAHYQSSTTALTVNHEGQFPSVTISFNLAPGVALGQAVDAIDGAEREIHVPGGIRGTFQGSAQAFKSSLANEPVLIAAALLTVYIVLGILYESYIHPITILSTLPSAGVGALLFLLLFHYDLSIIALIGIILLIGIVKKNAILMIDFALDAERNQGKNSAEAIYQACILRFRPIMMTTAAALLGGLPLAIGTGTGSELRRPLGIAIVGGLLVSQALTLFTTPVIYLYLDRFAIWSRRALRRSTTERSAPLRLAD